MWYPSIVLCLRVLTLTLPIQPIAHAATALEWPYNLPPHVKYYPEHEGLVKRNKKILERLQQEPAPVVKKMSLDPGEMFLLDYWLFDHDEYSTTHSYVNMTTALDFGAPLPLHATSLSTVPRLLERYWRLPVPAAGLFSKRGFVCPSGTNACSSIDRPNACCPSTSTCQIIPDTGLGDVGCCDAASTCAGSLSQCPAGYTGCPNNGGGCCLPGFQCFQEGCVQTSTTVVIATPSPTPSTSTTPPPTVIETTTVIVTTPSSTTPAQPSSSSVSSTTVPTTVTSSPTSASPSSTANSLVCSSGARSCPASLGGGCCPTDRACGRDFCPALTSSASLEPPVRGTSSSPSAIISGCPTGYYACSAYNPGACCQVDRDCSSTSCPARSGITVVNSGSITIAAPVGSSVSQGFLTGSCATGWSTCASSVGGGCCPSGYACGTAACTATVSGQTATEGKVAPNGTRKSGDNQGLLSFSLIFSIGLAVMLTA